MTSRSRAGVIVVSEEAISATVTLSLHPRPSSPVRHQEVEVQFHGEAPPENVLAIANEMVFRDAGGNEYGLQFGGSKWRLKDAEAFLG